MSKQVSTNSTSLSKYLAQIGQKGGRVRAQRLNTEQRQEVAREAAKARWGKKGSTSTFGYVPIDPPVLPTPKANIGANFWPYYRRAKDGDLYALIDYFTENHWWETDLGAAFYECIGYLACSGLPEHKTIVRRLIQLGEREGQQPLERPARLAEFNRLCALFGRHAQDLRGWIDNLRNEALLTKAELIPKRLWSLYENATTKAQSWIRGTREQHKARFRSGEQNALYESYLEDEALGSHEKLSKQLFCRAHTTAPKTPQHLFLLVAQSSPRLAVSIALRKFAAAQAGIAEGYATQKHAQKNS